LDNLRRKSFFYNDIGSDSPHGELVFSMIFLRYLETGIFERIDERKVLVRCVLAE